MTTAWLTVLAATVVMTAIVVVLVAAIAATRSRLASGEQVRIVINGDTESALTVAPGRSLLTTLADAGIFVPSACGGKGSCGVCKLVVLSGGGALLPSERSAVTRAQALAGERLSCQVRVREDLSIEVPPDVLTIQSLRCRVRSNRNVATFIRELVLEVPPGEAVEHTAGQFIQLRVPPHAVRYSDFVIEERFRADWEAAGLFTLASSVGPGEDVHRAYSMANYPGEGDFLMLNVRIATPPRGADVPPGKASSYVFSLRPGDEVEITGPFGEFRVKDTSAEMVFIGGGAGMAPLRSMILESLVRRRTSRKISFWYGARSLSEIFYAEDFDRMAREHENFEWHVALSEPLPGDAWQGDTGFIHDVVRRRFLESHPTPEDVEYYLCGPPMMLRACMALLDAYGVPPENVSYDEF